MIDLAKSSPVSAARLAAFEILLRVEEGAYASILLASREQKLSPPDRSLCHELVMGVLRRQLWLDRVVEQFSGRKSEEIDVAVQIILRLGLYQLRFLSRIPASAAVNEAVNLVGRARVTSARPFVNAVLRRATREPDYDPTSLLNDPIDRLAVATSHPRWLIQNWISSFGIEETQVFADANNEPAPIAFRVAPNNASIVEVIEELRGNGGTVTASEIAKDAWRISGATSLVGQLASQGKIYLQDEASQLVAEVLAAKGGQTVLDLCAAPGSKTTHIAARLEGSGSVIAGDIHEHRIKTAATLARLQRLTNIAFVVLDASKALPFDGVFDRVLVDAPCSGTGTLRRNPEIRWRISPTDITELSERQLRLLLNAASAVKPGGRLVYSTCSVEIAENEDVRRQFLENRTDFEPVKLAIERSLITGHGTARTWPHKHGTDGFFISAFKRV